MPNMSSHMSVAKKVAEILKINNNDYYKGNLFPDLHKDKRKSHYKIQGKIYEVPNIDYVIKNLDLKSKFNLGILTHLLLDKYYLEDYLTPRFKENVFDNCDIIYQDYDILNQKIVKHFKLNVMKLKKILIDFDSSIDNDKLNFNIKCLDIEKKGETFYLKEKEFIDFLENVSLKISNEIKKYI